MDVTLSCRIMEGRLQCAKKHVGGGNIFLLFPGFPGIGHFPMPCPAPFVYCAEKSTNLSKKDVLWVIKCAIIKIIDL